MSKIGPKEIYKGALCSLLEVDSSRVMFRDANDWRTASHEAMLEILNARMVDELKRLEEMQAAIDALTSYKKKPMPKAKKIPFGKSGKKDPICG